MNNSLVTHACGYVLAMFKDIAWAYSRESERLRDESRLIHEVTHRGTHVLLIELPDLCKHLIRCLDQGFFTSPGLPLGRSRKGSQVPLFMGDLYREIFDHDGRLRQTPNLEHVIVLVQALKGLAKLELKCSAKGIADAVNDYFAIESELDAPTLSWGSTYLYDDHSTVSSISTVDKLWNDREVFSSDDREIIRTIQHVADIVSVSLGDFYSESPRDLPKHGPGRFSNGPKEQDKYLFLEWPEKLDYAFPFDMYGQYDLLANGFNYDVSSRESPSKLIAVPKTVKKPRLIASEPNQHQWIQQLMWSQIHTKLKDTPIGPAIRFDSQDRNRSFAQKGSFDGTIATVDLSSASDRLSCKLLERLFRRNIGLLERLNACRTSVIRNAINKSWDTIVLKKFASQGSACTFPVQSVVYAIIASAVILHQKRMKPNIKNIKASTKDISVFGDDIAIKQYTRDNRDSLELLSKCLKYFQLKVNDSKTFSGDNPLSRFRESCGFDGWNGVNIAPVSIKVLGKASGPKAVMAAIDTSNSLHRNGYWHLAELVRSFIPKGVSSFVPIGSRFSTSLAFISFTGESLSHFDKRKKRYNVDLHSYEFKILKLKDVSDKVRQGGHSGVYRYFIDRPRPTTKWKAEFAVRSSTRLDRGWTPEHFIFSTAKQMMK